MLAQEEDGDQQMVAAERLYRASPSPLRWKLQVGLQPEMRLRRCNHDAALWTSKSLRDHRFLVPPDFLPAVLPSRLQIRFRRACLRAGLCRGEFLQREGYGRGLAELAGRRCSAFRGGGAIQR